MCIRDRCYHLSKYLARFLRVKHLTPCAVSRLPGSCPVPSERRVSGDPCRPGSLRACRKCTIFTHSITRRAKKGYASDPVFSLSDADHQGDTVRRGGRQPPADAARGAPPESGLGDLQPVSYTHLRAHETKANLVCR